MIAKKLVLAAVGVLLLALPAKSFAADCSTTAVALSNWTTTGFNCTVGDKLFSDFTFSSVLTGSGTGGPTSASGVNVQGEIVGGLEGLRFSGGFNVTGGLEVLDVLLGYSVSVVNPASGLRITDIDLSFNGAFTGTGATEITETAYSGTTVIGQAHVTNPPPVLSAVVVLSSPQTSVRLMKDIQLRSGASGTASMSVTDQYASQNVVPEPGSMILLGTGLVGLAGTLRRRLARKR